MLSQQNITIAEVFKHSNNNVRIMYYMLTKSLKPQRVKAQIDRMGMSAYDFMRILQNVQQNFFTTIDYKNHFVPAPTVSINWRKLNERSWQWRMQNNQTLNIPLHLFSEYLTVKNMQNFIMAIECSKDSQPRIDNTNMIKYVTEVTRSISSKVRPLVREGVKLCMGAINKMANLMREMSGTTTINIPNIDEDSLKKIVFIPVTIPQEIPLDPHWLLRGSEFKDNISNIDEILGAIRSCRK